MPENKITNLAFGVHGIDQEFLDNKKAKPFTKGMCEILLHFLNQYKEWPIVAHNAAYDRDKVLKKAFEKVGMEEFLPPKDRWRCTLKLAKRVPDIKERGLDNLLEYFDFEKRNPSAPHEAY